ncbi:hypothetical protein BMR1_03g00885 [Babesia microti strain RI]|uniref:Uncharacterized protein n=1 Tax=Babesia microti (strain RI) TaxID=1133968 RepID=A0A0K3AT87_BABMR|nr:hypothetical protein BMR1_03g00885 [Babesia microti strain RI]CTQ40776.1 hypothetical protein BMR1_03g00885 [Babesia microti strain RI]|eukprot:XP_012648787.1 hypothetical protein BMR1_03g00885 [Babesia microti strain RI]
MKLVNIPTIFAIYGLTTLLFDISYCIDTLDLQHEDGNGGNEGATGTELSTRDNRIIFELSQDSLPLARTDFDSNFNSNQIKINPRYRPRIISWDGYFYFELPSNAYNTSIYLDCIYNRQIMITISHLLIDDIIPTEIKLSYNESEILEFPHDFRFPKWMTDFRGRAFFERLNRTVPYIDVDLTQNELHDSLTYIDRSFRYIHDQYDAKYLIRSISYGDKKVDIKPASDVLLCILPVGYMKFTIRIDLRTNPMGLLKKAVATWDITVDDITQVPEWILNADNRFSSMIFNHPLPLTLDLSSETLEDTLEVSKYYNTIRWWLEYENNDNFIGYLKWHDFYSYELPRNMVLESICIYPIGNNQILLIYYGYNYNLKRTQEIDSSIITFPDDYTPPQWIKDINPYFFDKVKIPIEFIELDFTKDELPQQLKYSQSFDTVDITIDKEHSESIRIGKILLIDGEKSYIVPKHHIITRIILTVSANKIRTTLFYYEMSEPEEILTKDFYTELSSDFLPPKWIQTLEALLPLTLDLSSETLEHSVLRSEYYNTIHLLIYYYHSFIGYLKWHDFYSYKLPRDTPLRDIWIYPIGNNQILLIYYGYNYNLKRTQEIDSSIITFPDDYTPPQWIKDINPYFFDKVKIPIEFIELDFTKDELPQQLKYFQGFETVDITIDKEHSESIRIGKILLIDGEKSYIVPKHHIITRIILTVSANKIRTTLFYYEMSEPEEIWIKDFYAELSSDFLPPKWIQTLEAFMECFNSNERILSLQLANDDLPPEIILSKADDGVKLQLDYVHADNVIISSVSFGENHILTVPSDSFVNAIYVIVADNQITIKIKYNESDGTLTSFTKELGQISDITVPLWLKNNLVT